MASFKQQSVSNINPELNDEFQFRRDPRRLGQILSSWFRSLMPYILMILGVLIIIYPEKGDFIFALGVLLRVISRRDIFEFPFDAPEWESFISKKESIKSAIKSGRIYRKRLGGKGTLIFGIEYLRRRLLVTNADRETRHTLVLGSTGSGKTVLIISLLLQSLLQPGATSAVIVDGKADIALFWKIFAILKRLDRLHDFLVLNCLSPVDCLDTTKVHDDSVISHKMNPLNFGTPDQMKTITMGLGVSADGGDQAFWQGRSSSMVGAAYAYLIYERDIEGLDLNIQEVRDFLPLKQMLKKAARRDVPIKYRAALQQYLKTLPSISDAHFKLTNEEIDALVLNNKADEQHIYNLMMVNTTMSELSETMAHIFVTKLSEINMTDVCLKGRVLLVLLPSVAKSPDAVAGLGRLLLESLRPILMRAAGYVLQGNRLETLDNRPSSAQYPVRLFLDEYGMYAVKGFYMIVALVRAYGFHVLFGAQTAGMFQRAGGPEEYQALMGNLNQKIILKNEDHEESLKLVLGRTGKVFQVNQERVQSQLVGAQHDGESKVQETDMVSARMLASAQPGEGIYITDGDVYPFRCINFDIPEVETSRLNYFAQVLQPTEDDMERVRRQYLSHSMEYLDQANSHLEQNIDTLVSFKQFETNLKRVKESNKVSFLSNQVMLSFGMLSNQELHSEEVSDSDLTSIDDGLKTEQDIDDEMLNDVYVSDAEIQIETLVDMDGFDRQESEPEIDFGDFSEADQFYDYGYDEYQAEQDESKSLLSDHYDSCNDTEAKAEDSSTVKPDMFKNTAAGLIQQRIREQFASTNAGESGIGLAIDSGLIDLNGILEMTLSESGDDQTAASDESIDGSDAIVTALTYPTVDNPEVITDDLLQDTISALKEQLTRS